MITIGHERVFEQGGLEIPSEEPVLSGESKIADLQQEIALESSQVSVITAPTTAEKLRYLAYGTGMLSFLSGVVFSMTKDVKNIATDVPLEMVLAQEKQVQGMFGLQIPDAMLTQDNQGIGLLCFAVGATCIILAHKRDLRNLAAQAVSDVKNLFTYS